MLSVYMAIFPKPLTVTADNKVMCDTFFAWMLDNYFTFEQLIVQKVESVKAIFVEK
jgi:hypothetical protein